MKRLIILPVLFLCAFANAQNAATLDSSMRLFRAGNLAGSLVGFKNIFNGNNELLKQKAVVTLSEYWLDNTNSIRPTQEVADFGNALIGYIRTIAAKNNPDSSDLYTIGIGTWTVISTGTLKREASMSFYGTALNALQAATKQGHRKSSYYMAQVLRRFKLLNPVVPFDDIFGWTAMAMDDRKSILPVLELLTSFGNAWYKKELADTSRMVITGAVDLVLSKMPDSFHLLIGHVWKNAGTGFQGDQPVSHLNALFRQLSANNTAVPLIGKGYAWHLLYKYMYKGNMDNSLQHRITERSKLMDTIRRVYSADDNKLVMLAAEFITLSKAHDIYEFANMQEADWAISIKPAFSDNVRFYQAAALSGNLFSHVIVSDPNSKSLSATIAETYKEKLNRLHEYCRKYYDIPASYSKTELGNAFLKAIIRDKANIEQLRTIPAFSDNMDLKLLEVNAGFLYVHIFMLAHEGTPLTEEVDDIIKKLSALTDTEKKRIDLSVITTLNRDLSMFNAVSSALDKGVEIETIEPFTNKKRKVKFYPKSEAAPKMREIQARLQRFIDNRQ